MLAVGARAPSWRSLAESLDPACIELIYPRGHKSRALSPRATELTEITENRTHMWKLLQFLKPPKMPTFARRRVLKYPRDVMLLKLLNDLEGGSEAGISNTHFFSIAF